MDQARNSKFILGRSYHTDINRGLQHLTYPLFLAADALLKAEQSKAPPSIFRQDPAHPRYRPAPSSNLQTHDEHTVEDSMSSNELTEQETDQFRLCLSRLTSSRRRTGRRSPARLWRRTRKQRPCCTDLRHTGANRKCVRMRKKTYSFSKFMKRK